MQIVAVVFLICAGLAAIYSATFEAGKEASGLYKKQLIVALFSITIYVAAAAVSPKVYFALSYVIFTAAMILLILPLLMKGGSETARWIKLGVLTFQPSEIAKLAMIIVLARFLNDRQKEAQQFFTLVKAAVIVIIPVILVIMEPDLGTSFVFIMIAIPMLIYGGISLMHILLVGIPIVVLIASLSIYVLIPVMLILIAGMLWLKLKPILIVIMIIGCSALGFAGPKVWDSLHPYQQRRIKTFLNPEADPQGAGYQNIQSKIAVGSGGLWGKGYLKGTQGQLKFLPAGHTDFIFSIFSEEFGFAGASLIVLGLFTLVYRGFKNAFRCRYRFYALVLVGCASHFMFHSVINIGMTMGLLPVTGLPLPFMSYGGSSLTLNMAVAGVMLGISARRREY